MKATASMAGINVQPL